MVITWITGSRTHTELSVYDPALAAMLDRIFDEFGLIVCGWSGDWAIALRAAIERCLTCRFSTYWTTRGEISPKATDLFANGLDEYQTVNEAYDKWV
jgi:hypothetical protein